jgi:hypothetical protein
LNDSITSLDFLKRAYPNNQVGKFSFDTQGIYFKGILTKNDLEKINHLGFEIQHLQSWESETRALDFGIIAVVKERRAKK